MKQTDEDKAADTPARGTDGASAVSGIDEPFIHLRDTGRFLDVLASLKCSLALSRRPSGVALLGVDNGVPTLSACLLPRSMGMTVSGNRLAVATIHELMIFANVSNLAPLYPARPNHYDAVFVPRVSYYTGDLDLHDMVFDRHIVLAVNTRYSCISVIDGYFNFTPIWQPPFVTDFGPDDRCHLNGMAFHDGKVRYATALGETSTPFGWRKQMATGGIVMEVPSGRIVASGLSMPHSPRLIGGRLFVLEGGRGHVLEIDAASGAKRVVAALPGFTHGLAEYGGVLFVGLSRLRDKRGPQGLPIESESTSLVAGVAALDARTGEVLGTLQFENGVDEVFDVQVMPNILRGEILSPWQWAETPSIATMKGGFWQQRPREEDEPAS
ncbi:TIGR03032 family protein [Paraburkholderia kururiensis]|uniref:TIGR03032 family protein n=1 Tax=Paraburkholderia kururiensis TaxID=984307 RepID=A0ABZ0WRE9_9BURK|nr:TIGR03032 family protein [Paraburkholderia kururiensis]WQD79955.1 TIGR03032 family protein [Paraburkholderia kururiensis]